MTLWCRKCRSCQIMYYEQKIKGYVKGVEGVKYCTILWIKDQKAMYVQGVEGVKYFTEWKIKGYVKGVESGAYCTIFDPKSAACKVVLTLTGSVFDIVGSYEQTGQPIWLIWH